MPRSLSGDLARLLLALLVGIVAVAAYASVRIWQVGEQDERDRPVDAIVVMGAAQYDDRRPSPVFRARLDHAIELFLNGAAPRLVVTGGIAPGDSVAEADVARDYAVSRAVPPGAILAERSGRNTEESLRGVARLLLDRDMTRALFVSDRTHMLRVLRIADDLGIDAYGSPARQSPTDLDPAARAGALAHELAGLAVHLLIGPPS